MCIRDSRRDAQEQKRADDLRQACKPKVQRREPELLVPRIDVYKRQDGLLWPKVTIKIIERFAGKRGHVVKNPVSYTHLDVYKRQRDTQRYNGHHQPFAA